VSLRRPKKKAWGATTVSVKGSSIEQKSTPLLRIDEVVKGVKNFGTPRVIQSK
jgi:hypothetical protein